MALEQIQKRNVERNLRSFIQTINLLPATDIDLPPSTDKELVGNLILRARNEAFSIKNELETYGYHDQVYCKDIISILEEGAYRIAPFISVNPERIKGYQDAILRYAGEIQERLDGQNPSLPSHDHLQPKAL